MRRLPPSDVEKNLRGLLNLIPDKVDELLQRIDQPLQEAIDDSVNIFFMKSYCSITQR